MMKHFYLYWNRTLQGFVSILLALLLVAIPAQQAVLAICSPSATSGNNTITCDGADDTVDGLAGNDQINGGGGNDTLMGSAGNDTLTGGAGNDSLTGGVGNDAYAFDTDSALGADAVTEASGGGTDNLNFSGSNNDVTVNLSTTGNQTVNSNLTLNLTSTQVENVTGGNGNDTVTGNTLNNSLSGGNGNDTLSGGAGNDSLSGNAGNDSLTGDAGNDTYVFNTNSALGTDSVTEASGGGTDTLSFSGSNNVVTVNLATTGNQTVNSNLTLNLISAQVENVTGGNNGDTITGNTLNNVLSGGNGNDTLNGGAGNDTLTGGAGNDTLTGSTGNDVFAFNTNSALGTDTVIEASGGGTDTLNFTGSNNVVTVNLATTGNQTVNSNLTLNLTSAQVENVTGGNNNDTITGNTLNNSLSGGNGNDAITGDAGNDVLTGGAGDDTYSFNTNSSLGADTLNEAVGGGTDTLTFTGSTNDVAINLALTGNQTVNSNLTLNMTSAQVENVTGGDGNDTLTGNNFNNTLTGGAGDDTYVFNTNSNLSADTLNESVGGGTDTLTFSASASDVAVNLALTGNQTVNSNLTLNIISAQVENVTGGNGNDTLTGNNLNNTVTGGGGNDTLNGGAGDDTYAFNTNSSLGADTLNEAVGDGTDMLAFTGSTNDVAVNLALTGNQTVNANLTLNMISAQVDNVTGGDGNDTLTGNNLNNTLTGGAGNDTLDGGAGNDMLIGGAGDDTYAFNANSSLGADTLNEAVGGGIDTLTFTGSTNDVAVNLALTGNQTVNSNLTLNMTSAQVENVTGGDGNDTLTGNNLNNTVTGGAGDDTLDGGAGNDTLTGGAGDDVLKTGSGVDTIDGGAGDDEIVVAGTNENGDTADGGAGVNVFRFSVGATGILSLTSNGEDTLDFSLFGNSVTIDLSNNNQQDVGGGLLLTLNGWFKNVIGSSSDDQITGNSMDNTINGGNGNDTIDGGAGTDTLDGGADTDTVQNYEAQDTNTNFENGMPTPQPTAETKSNQPSPVKDSSASSFDTLEWGRQVALGCDSNLVEFVTLDGQLVRFENLCGYSVVLNQLDDTLAQTAFPNDGQILTGISVTLFKDGAVVSELPVGATVELKFPAPAGVQLTSFHWDEATGAWVEIPVVVNDGYAAYLVETSGAYALTYK